MPGRAITAAMLAAFLLTTGPTGRALAEESVPSLAARVIAVGIAGAGAVAPVGSFHPGGPIHDKPEFAAYTKPGRVLDASRVLVASSSNYGAPRAQAEAPEGSILSLDPSGGTIVIPAGFAASGAQPGAADGRAILFTAQSPAFLNSVRTPGAASAAFPAVSNPLGISINNAFGRLWFANAPHGKDGIGTLSISDPGGEPLAGAPSKLLGGVFAGDLTNRPQQLVPGGLRAGAVATALLGMSPDGSKRAVFAVLTADGALAQAHTEFAIDGLAPAGTVAPLALPMRAGMIFNWVPDRVLYVTEPEHNAIAVLTLANDDKVFRLAGARHWVLPGLDMPVDLAPAVPEVANPGFASNTTLAGGSDIYVANRGNGTILRVSQHGKVVAARRVTLPDGSAVGGGRLNGIAVSPDAQTIWLTLDGAVAAHPGAPGALIAVPAFGPAHKAERDSETISRGAALFRTEFTPQQGLGPLFNARSCIECHLDPTPGGMGLGGLATVHRVGRFAPDAFEPLLGRGGPVARSRSVAELGVACPLAAGLPALANLTSVRNASPLYGLGAIDDIPDSAILAAAAQSPGKGRPHLMRDADGRERVGRFGWKADAASLQQFVGEAFRNELGITNPIAPVDLVDTAGCSPVRGAGPEDDGTAVHAVTAYLASLAEPRPRSAIDPEGSTLFAAAGCPACHVPALAGARGAVALYSDLLLHDMGPALDDRVVQGNARGAEWRTTPLWGVGLRKRFLHDARATSLADAILAHDGEAAASTKAFRAMPVGQQQMLLAFLQTL